MPDQFGLVRLEAGEFLCQVGAIAFGGGKLAFGFSDLVVQGVNLPGQFAELLVHLVLLGLERRDAGTLGFCVRLGGLEVGLNGTQPLVVG